MDDSEQFAREVGERIEQNASDEPFRNASAAWIDAADRARYEYNFSWLGLPIIQYPQDLMAMQQLIWQIRPRWIIETGVARGGSAIFYASMLELLAGDGRVLGIDIDIRQHNRRRLEAHPLFTRVELMEGSSTDAALVERVQQRVAGAGPVLVCLDANHTHDHVLAELHAYAPMVGAGSYVVVFDTIIEQLGGTENRDWSKSDNPATAVTAFLQECDRFEIDRTLSAQLMISSNPNGFLRCLTNP